MLGLHQAAELLAAAVDKRDDENTLILVEHLLASGDTTQLSMQPVRRAFEDVASQGRWDLCARIKPLIAKGHLEWMRGQCWEQAAKRNDASLLDHLDELDLHQGSVSLHQVLDAGCKPLFMHLVQQRSDMLPNLDQSNRACGQALQVAASCGTATCQTYLAHLRDTRQPDNLLQSKLASIVQIAWEKATLARDVDAATCLAHQGLWPGAELDFNALFHGGVGPALCRDENAKAYLASRVMTMDKDAMDALDQGTIDRMLASGLPLLAWRSSEGCNLAHVIMEGKAGYDMERALAWILLRDPAQLTHPNQSGQLPLDLVTETNRNHLDGFGEKMRALAQAASLRQASDEPLLRGRGPRF